MTGIMGMTDEEQEAINALKNPGLTKGQLAQLGLGFFTGMPFLTMANAQRIRRQNEAKALEQAQRVATRVRAAENKAAFQRGDNQKEVVISLVLLKTTLYGRTRWWS